MGTQAAEFARIASRDYLSTIIVQAGQAQQVTSILTDVSAVSSSPEHKR